jgi:hypothetical protein
MGEVAVHHVFAYLDPGSGSMLIQVIIAGSIAIPVLFINYIKRGWRSLQRRLPGYREEPSPGERTEL